MKRMGLDLGSTTVKGVVLGEDGSLLYSSYRRHYSKISQTAAELLQEVAAQFGSEELLLSISGSAGMGLSNALQLPFVALASSWGTAGFYASTVLSYLAAALSLAGIAYGLIPRKMMLNYENSTLQD